MLPPRDLAAELGAGGDPARPNVYHFLFDALQGDLVEPCLPPGGRESLAGFVRFRATAPVRMTGEVLPAILTGRWLPPWKPEARMGEALRSQSSLLSNLRGAGYRTVGFVPPYLYGTHRAAFDLSVLHGENLSEPDLPGLHAAVFLRALGLRRASPGGGGAARRRPFPRLRHRLPPDGLGGEAVHLRAAARVAPEHGGPPGARAAPSPRGRYTLVHLLLPHNPYRPPRRLQPGSAPRSRPTSRSRPSAPSCSCSVSWRRCVAWAAWMAPSSSSTATTARAR